MDEKFRNIKLLVMDCDGVLTDGRLYFSSDGEVMKSFYVRDGQGLVMWHAAGYRSGVISGRNSSIVDLRARQLGVEFILQGREEKVAAFKELTDASGIAPADVAFIGDDTPDAELFPYVGLAVAVGDAHEAVKAAAHYITKAEGGRGAVREVIDMLLAAKSPLVCDGSWL